MSNFMDKQSVPERIRNSLSNKEYRHSYADEFLNTWIATQIKILREQFGWKQSDLAREAGMKHQSTISRLEDMNYSSWSLSTLKRLAYAFDVRLKVSFESFGSLIQDFTEFSAEFLKRPDYARDPFFNESYATAIASTQMPYQAITTIVTPQAGLFRMDSPIYLNVWEPPKSFNMAVGSEATVFLNVSGPRRIGWQHLSHAHNAEFLWTGNIRPINATLKEKEVELAA